MVVVVMVGILEEVMVVVVTEEVEVMVEEAMEAVDMVEVVMEALDMEVDMEEGDTEAEVMVGVDMVDGVRLRMVGKRFCRFRSLTTSSFSISSSLIS